MSFKNTSHQTGSFFQNIPFLATAIAFFYSLFAKKEALIFDYDQLCKEQDIALKTVSSKEAYLEETQCTLSNQTYPGETDLTFHNCLLMTFKSRPFLLEEQTGPENEKPNRCKDLGLNLF